MHVSVYFYDQALCGGTEVNDEGADNHLPPELDAVEPAIP
jgi:hypothetical protein